MPKKKRKLRKIKNGFNYEVYAGIFLLIVVVFVIIMFCYEGIRKGTADYGPFGNSVFLGLADMFQFPFNTVVQPSSDAIYLLGILVNIAIYTAFTYFLTKFFLKSIRR